MSVLLRMTRVCVAVGMVLAATMVATSQQAPIELKASIFAPATSQFVRHSDAADANAKNNDVSHGRLHGLE